MGLWPPKTVYFTYNKPNLEAHILFTQLIHFACTRFSFFLFSFFFGRYFYPKAHTREAEYKAEQLEVKWL